MKLIIFDFDGPINNLICTKKKVINDVIQELELEFSEKNTWELINYIDQIYGQEKIYDYPVITQKVGLMVKTRWFFSVNNHC